MAICNDCRQEMTDKTIITCKTHQSVAFWTGGALDPVPYENETVKASERDTHRCPDCGIALGGYHHVGCDMERCPRCKGQLISCDCDVV